MRQKFEIILFNIEKKFVACFLHEDLWLAGFSDEINFRKI